MSAPLIRTLRLVLVLCMASAARAQGDDRTGERPSSPSRRIHGALEGAQAAAGSFVVVEYVLERAGHGFGAVGQRAEMAAAGTIVTPDGLIVMSGNIFPDEQDETRTPARPHTFVVRTADGARLRAELAGHDADRSLAFLRVSASGGRTFPHVVLQEGEAPRVGDRLVLVSLLPEKFRYQPSYVPASIAAVIEGPRRVLDVDVNVQDTSIGLPVFDDEGRAVGIVTTDPFGSSTAGPLTAPLELLGAISRGKAPGFPVVALAADVLPLVAAPPSEASVPTERAWIGVTLQPVDRALADYLDISHPTGVMVTSVWAGSPAAEAGLEVEDVIVGFDGRDVEVTSEDALPAFIDKVQQAGPGREVTLKIVRKGRTRTAKLRLGVAPTTAEKAEELRDERFGLVAQDVTIDVIMSRGWSRDTVGALVTEVETAGWAQVGGLEPGDLVLRVDGAEITNIVDLAAALDRAARARAAEVVFFVLRDPDTLFVPVRTKF